MYLNDLSVSYMITIDLSTEDIKRYLEVYYNSIKKDNSVSSYTNYLGFKEQIELFSNTLKNYESKRYTILDLPDIDEV
jgi:hypothetical protein